VTLHFFSYDKVRAKSFNVIQSHLLCNAFLKVTLDFSISALNSLPLFFLLANKRRGTEEEMEVTNLKNLKSFLIIIKLSSNKCLYFNTSIHHCLQLLYFTLTLLGYVFFWCEA